VYEVFLERTAERDLKRLPKEEYDRMINPIKALARDPRPHSGRKLTGSRSDWRIRVGDYRILYEINDKTKVVRIMRIRHRREVYRS
jgi:mRNA interferase RelE/StbE